MFIGQCQLRVQAMGKQQCEKSLLPRRQSRTSGCSSLKLRNIMSQFELHFLSKENNKSDFYLTYINRPRKTLYSRLCCI